MKKAKRCGNCLHLNPKDRTDIGGLVVAKCIHPDGTTIGDTPIHNDYVEMNSRCSKHEALK